MGQMLATKFVRINLNKQKLDNTLKMNFLTCWSRNSKKLSKAEPTRCQSHENQSCRIELEVINQLDPRLEVQQPVIVLHPHPDIPLLIRTQQTLLPSLQKLVITNMKQNLHHRAQKRITKHHKVSQSISLWGATDHSGQHFCFQTRLPRV